jgi:hypothetical protein
MSRLRKKSGGGEGGDDEGETGRARMRVGGTAVACVLNDA